MAKTGLDELEQFTMTRGEYAKELDITPNAVRMRMRTGKLSGEYRFDGNKYLFRAPEPPRDNIVNTTGINTTPKKKYNRGNHYRASYPNEAFKLHNQNKILAKLNKTDPEFVKKVPELEKIYKQQKANRILNNLNNAKIKNYGGLMPGGGEAQNASIVVKSLREKEPALGSFFIGKVPCDTGGGEPEKDSDVVFTQYELDNYGPIEERTEFKNKVEEEIYRTKKHLLKTRGGWD